MSKISVMPMGLSMVPLHSLGHNDQNEVKHNFFSHLIPLVSPLLPCFATCIISGIILLIRWRQLKQSVMWFLWSCDAVGTSVNTTWHWWHLQWSTCLKQGATCFFSHVMLASHDHNDIIKSTIALVSSRLSKWGATWFFSHLTLGTGISIMWYQWHCY